MELFLFIEAASFFNPEELKKMLGVSNFPEIMKTLR